MFSDLQIILFWWLILLLFTAPGAGLARAVLGNLSDKGYPFIKVLGLVIVSYLVWLSASVKVAPFTRETISLVFVLITVFGLFLPRLASGKFNREIKINPLLIFEEVLFFGGLVFWSLVRGFNPEIHGLEKYMDFGFINSILKSDYFPPLDMWLSKSPTYQGHFINYYYFGHYLTAFLTKFSGVSPEVTFNLMLGTIFGLTFSGSFSLGYNLFKQFTLSLQIRSVILPLMTGLLAAFLVTLSGNLHTLYAFTQGYQVDQPKPPWEVSALKIEAGRLQFNPNIDGYWYPNATRFIPNTIHEFPMYSFVVSDLHGHVLDIPFVLLVLAVLFSFFVQLRDYACRGIKSCVSTLKDNYFYLVTLGLLTAIMYMTNAWDSVIYLALYGLLLITAVYLKSNSFTKIFPTVFLFFLPVAVLAFLFALPFHLSFTPFAHGVGIVCGHEIGKIFGLNLAKIGPFLFEAGNCQRTPLYMFLILWGFFLFNAGAFSLYTYFRHKDVWPDVSTIFILALIFISFSLLIFPEFAYLKDIYPLHYRANTMFKLGYQAFMMLSFVSAFTIIRLLAIRSRLRYFWGVFLFPQLFLVFIYPYFAIKSYYGLTCPKDNRETLECLDSLRQNYKGLDGLNYLKNIYPDDYRAILWLRENANGQPTIVEAVGESYRDNARISANTGLPTVLGWPVHEWLWRGKYDEAGVRTGEVQRFYETQDLDEAKTFLKKYQVKYIVVGTLDRQQYPNIQEGKFSLLGRPVFALNTTTIYKVKPLKL